MRRLLPLIPLALALAGCGGTGGAGPGGAAQLLPKNTLAYVTVDANPDSEAWSAVDDLLDKFPGRSKLLALIDRELAQEGIDYERDVKPAIGDEVVIAVFAGGPENFQAVVMTQPKDRAKLDALVRKLNESEEKSEDKLSKKKTVAGWTAYSDEQSALDNVQESPGGGALADSSTFVDAFAELEESAVAKAYVDGAAIVEAAKQASADDRKTLSLFGLDKLEWIAAQALAEDDGARIDAAIKGAGSKLLAGGGKPYVSKLAPSVPEGALGFYTFSGAAFVEQIQALKSDPDVREGLREFEEEAGVSLDDVLPLFRNEVALYARPSAPIPEFSLLLEAPNPKRALATIDRLMRRVATLTFGTLSSSREDGVAVKTLRISGFPISWAALDGKVIVTTGPSGIRDVRSGGKKLPEDATYRRAREAAGAPDATTTFFYLNLKDTIPLVTTFIGFSGEEIPPDVEPNLRPLRSFLAYATRDGDLARLSLFLEVG